MSTIDTSSWNPDADLNVEIEGIPLNSDANIAQTWQALRVLMAAVKGDGDAIKAMIDVMQGATASADGASGLVPKPEAGDQNKVLKGDGTWGAGTDSNAVHKTDNETIAGDKTFSNDIIISGGQIRRSDNTGFIRICGGKLQQWQNGAKVILYGADDATNPGQFILFTGGTGQKQLAGKPDGTLTWVGGDITGDVHSSGAETIAGVKTFTDDPRIENATPLLQIINTNDTSYGDVRFQNSSRVSKAVIRGDIGAGQLIVANACNKGNWNSGARVLLDNDGSFSILAKNGTNENSLVGTPSGTLTWGGGDITGDVHLTGSETVTGSKTFTSPITVDTSVCYYSLVSPSASGSQFICGGSHWGAAQGAHLAAFGAANSGAPGQFRLHAGDSTGYKRLIGKPDGTLTWDGQSIQTASDERLKTNFSAVPDVALDAWGDVQWGQFQFLDAVSVKGEGARLHLGLIAQRVKAVFEKRGLDACAYGILCHEERPATADEPATDLWMVRYAEAQAMEAAFQRRRIDKLEAKINALEEKLNG